MKRHYHLVAATLAVFVLAGCLGSAFDVGNSASPPPDVKLVAGDNSVTITWSMAPNVEYWIFSAPADSITTDNWSKLSGAKATINAVSPQVVGGLLNGYKYSFTINGRIDGGPGGPGSASLSATPRIAGTEWSAGTPLANDLRATAFGTVFVAAGARGALYSSPDFNSLTPVTWTPLANPLPGLPDLNAVTFGNSIYLAAGTGGTLLFSSDAITWAAQNSPTTNNLYALTSNDGSASFVALAAGAHGTIINSSDGKTWTTVNSGTANDLYGLTYGRGIFVAVGAKGTLLTSTDGTTWMAVASNTASKLNSVTYGVNSTTAIGSFVAVGEAGTFVTSTDGVTWTVQSPITSGNLASVTYGHQFIAVGDKGMIFSSTDGLTWQTRASGTVNDLTSVGHSVTSYAAVGKSGTNLSAI